jgi:hypothetical protein
MSAAALIRQFEDCGAHFELRPDGVHLIRPKGTVLPPELIEAARARKAEIRDALARKVGQRFHATEAAPIFDAADREERAAIMEHEAGMPREWAEAFAAIAQSSAPGDFERDRWQDTLDGMLRFSDEWSGRAAALGWRCEEVFGLDLTAPAARVDRRGLALCLGGGAHVESIDDRGADIRTPGGARQRFYRRSLGSSR